MLTYIILHKLSQSITLPQLGIRFVLMGPSSGSLAREGSWWQVYKSFRRRVERPWSKGLRYKREGARRYPRIFERSKCGWV